MNTLFEVKPTTEIIRALWWNEPYASLMLPPINKIETRNRHTNVRGKVLICSCKRMYTEMQIQAVSGEWQTGRIFEALRENHIKELPGRAIAIADLVDCFPFAGTAYENQTFVAYRSGLWCWKFENVQPIEPFFLSGKQGWAVLDEETKANIKPLNI